jgi:hypothetical protein
MLVGLVLFRFLKKYPPGSAIPVLWNSDPHRFYAVPDLGPSLKMN